METVKDGNFDMPSSRTIMMGRTGQSSLHFSSAGLNFADDEYISEEEAKKRREILERRPSYRRILNDLSASELDVKKEVDSNISSVAVCNESGQSVIQTAGLMNAAKTNGDVNISGLVTPPAHGSLLQYSQAQDVAGPSQVFVPSGVLGGLSLNRSMVHSLSPSSIGGPTPGTTALMSPSIAVASLHQDSPMPQHGHGDGTRKRELRLLKNREAAKECRRKKKEYVKCLENRVAVLENQNKALIEELKTLKELYCRKAD